MGTYGEEMGYMDEEVMNGSSGLLSVEHLENRLRLCKEARQRIISIYALMLH